MRLDIHNYPLRLQRSLALVRQNSHISSRNKELILKFYDDCAIQGLSKGRLTRLVDTMVLLAKETPTDFDTASIDDIKRLVRTIEEHNFTAWTKSTHKAILKKFYKWLKGNNEEYPPEVKWIKAVIKRKDLPLLAAQELITEDEVMKAISSCDHPRNKAFLGVLFESGCRIGEIGSMTLKNIAFDTHGAILNVNGKTGSRRVRIIRHAPLLATWINNHPLQTNPEGGVWINIGATRHHQPMSYNALAKVIRDSFKRAGISKRCNPHLFRHSRASIMANHLTEFQMNHYFGWTQGSDMPSTYVHLSGKDLDGAILKINGFDQPKGTIQEIKPKVCTRCDTLNSAESSYCNKCAAILDDKTMLQAQRQYLEQEKATTDANALMNLLMKDAGVRKFLSEKILDLGLNQKMLKL